MQATISIDAKHFLSCEIMSAAVDSKLFLAMFFLKTSILFQVHTTYKTVSEVLHRFAPGAQITSIVADITLFATGQHLLD